jgi:hypothetical protein
VIFAVLNLLFTVNEIKDDEMNRARSTNGAKRKAYRILVGKPEGK